MPKGENHRLEVETAPNGSHERDEEGVNLWVNRQIGDERFPDDGVRNGPWPEWALNGTPRPTGRVTFNTHRFYKNDDPLQPSGLIGLVTIGPMR